MILTDEEIKAIDAYPWGKSVDYARAIEAAVLAKLGEQKPVAWRVFDGEGGYDYFGYTDNEDYRDEFLKRNPNPIYRSWVEPLYTHPAPDVVREQKPYALEIYHADTDSYELVYSVFAEGKYGLSISRKLYTLHHTGAA